MKKIEKQESPGFFSDYIARHKPTQWNEITSIRSKLREHIWNEQSGCCAYTEIRLHNCNNCHIDHFRTRKLYPELTFDYTNLLVSCNAEEYGAKHKDKQVKRQEDYVDLINPVEESVGTYIEYAFTGKAFSRDGSKKGETTINYLNLNEKSLLERRKVALLFLVGLEELTVDEVVNSIGEFETMIRELY